MISNDVMRYPVVRMKALVANQGTVLTKTDVEMLCGDTRSSGERGNNNYFLKFYRRTFGEENCRFLNAWANNIPRLKDPIKRDIAVYIPIVCISESFKYAAIHWSPLGVPTGGKNLLDVDLEKKVRAHSLEIFPEFLCDNGAQNEVYNEDAVGLVSKIQADVLYIDPPYACRAGGEYEGNYAIFDDLVSILWGRGHTVLDPTDSKCEIKPYTYFGKQSSALKGFRQIFSRSRHIPTVIVSYNSTSKIYPEEIATQARNAGRDVDVLPVKEINLPVTSKKAKQKTTTEYLICCRVDSAEARLAA